MTSGDWIPNLVWNDKHFSVIPANAGIQLPVSSQRKLGSRVKRTILWIPNLVWNDTLSLVILNLIQDPESNAQNPGFLLPQE
jgi:hypothetical protein